MKSDLCFFFLNAHSRPWNPFIDPWGIHQWPQERSKLRAGELSAIDKAVDLLSSEEVGRTQGPMSAGATGGRWAKNPMKPMNMAVSLDLAGENGGLMCFNDFNVI